jgi:hypothetical protein
MEGGGGAVGASDGDEFERAWRGASRHADQHEQPRLHIERSRQDADALQLMKQCLELRIKVLSESHPDTLSTLMTLLQWSGVDLESLSSIVGDASTSGDE